MNNLEALTESIKEECFQKEPLARAILTVLEKHDLVIHQEVLQTFSTMIENDISLKIQETLENDLATHV